MKSTDIWNSWVSLIWKAHGQWHVEADLFSKTEMVRAVHINTIWKILPPKMTQTLTHGGNLKIDFQKHWNVVLGPCSPFIGQFSIGYGPYGSYSIIFQRVGTEADQKHIALYETCPENEGLVNLPWGQNQPWRCMMPITVFYRGAPAPGPRTLDPKVNILLIFSILDGPYGSYTIHNPGNKWTAQTIYGSTCQKIRTVRSLYSRHTKI